MLIDYATGSSLVYLGEAMVSCTRHDGSEPVISSMSPGGNAVFSVFLYNIQV
jgi:ribonuclease PH